ncbi:MAG: hypothetical protein RL660_2195 [Bacteroidota bacterium]
MQQHEKFAEAKAEAFYANAWFEPAFIDNATNAICEAYLKAEVLEAAAAQYQLSNERTGKCVGIICAGNIPMVGMHDMICALLAGHNVLLKLSSKDEVLMKATIAFLHSLDSYWQQAIVVSEMLKGCDAYIATGSNNTARYFEQYFGKYKSIIRRNRTSAAILHGTETTEELKLLAKDMLLYFGMGCRNITKLYVPQDYNFEALLNEAFVDFAQYKGHTKLKNNYDYNLAIHLLNGKQYMSNELLLFVENDALFSPISTVHYSHYSNIDDAYKALENNNDLQCIVGHRAIPFGQAQAPSFLNFADGVDTLAFLADV